MAIMDWMIIGFSLFWRVPVYPSKIMGVSFNSPKFLFGWKLFSHPNGMWNERKEGRREKTGASPWWTLWFRVKSFDFMLKAKEILNAEVQDHI